MNYIAHKAIKMKTLITLQNWMLHIMIAVALLALAPLVAQAQSYDPYTSNLAIAPAPLLPVEFGGSGTFTFEAGNNGGDALIYDPAASPGNWMGITISLINGVPNVPGAVNPDAPTAVEGLTAISGQLRDDYFDFTYNPVNFTYTGVQKADIPGSTVTPSFVASFEAVIQYRVTVNTFGGSLNNGAQVNVQPPGYTNPQPTDNDGASDVTNVEAIDFGDAPISGTAPDGISAINYGSAASVIDLSKDVNGFYNRYVYLGSSVDPENANQASAAADGDDLNQSNGLNPDDDENGVTFPVMIPGETVSIPVVLTLVDAVETFPTGVLNAWIDWNGDGDWGDAGEQIVSAQSFSASATTNLTVAVPPGAINNVFTYARFRFGNGANTISTAPYGEVEDYQVFIGEPTAVTLGKVDLKAVLVEDFLNELGANQMDDAALLDILRAWDPELAASAGAGRDGILAALMQYLDPDGDGLVAVLHWDTLEERGTVGFYVERADGESDWVLINNQMLPGMVFAPLGAEYKLADPGAQGGRVYQYQLIELEASGNTREYGPFELELK
jgi:hypothetical protein